MRIAVAVAIAGFSLTGISLGSEAFASIKKQTNIPAQGLGTALQALAQERQFQVVYLSDAVDGFQTSGAVGELTADQALTKLLSGTGLTFKYLDDRTVTVLPTASAGSATTQAYGRMNAISDDSASTAIDIGPAQADAKEAQKTSSFWDRFRLAQVDPGRIDASVKSDAAAELGGDQKLEEIIVTATKREERLIDVPQSVTVLSADAFAKMGAVQFRDFADAVPGLSFQTEGAGTGQISLRGVSIGKDASPTVGIYVDEVPYGSSSSFARASQFTLDAALFDVDRIEVLRGPQGTLYGASTMGGLLKYVTKRPDATRFGVDAQTGLSSTRHGDVNYHGAMALNAPIVTDKVALRASGFYSRDGGYIDNVALGQQDVNSSNIHGGRADLLLTPTDALTIRINGFLQDISSDGFPFADYTQAGAPVDGDLEQRRRFAESFDQRFRLVSGTLSYDLGPAVLTSISSYQTIRSRIFRDQSARFVPQCVPVLGRPCTTVAAPFGASTDKFTQEVRLASDGAQVLEWLIGGFYTEETSEDNQEVVARDSAGQPLPTRLIALFIPSRYEELAAFSDLTWHLTEKFDVTGGVRYAKNRTRFQQFGSGVQGLSTPLSSSSDDVFTYLANARYHFSDRATGYLRYATGYRPGGPNYAIVGAKPVFEADRLKSYEVGFKSETADQRFALDVAGYYVDWDNIITTVSVGGFSVRDNAAGGAGVRGAELALTARPTRAFTLTGAVAYQNAELSEAVPNLRAAKGEQLPGVPRFTAALNADYELSVASLQPTLGATLRYVDDRVADFDNNGARPQFLLPDYSMVDLRAGCTLGSVQVQLYVRNLFDERGQLLSRVAPTTLNPLPIAIVQPRTIGVTASTSF